MKSIYISAGGTGGHINAALSVGKAFEKQYRVKYLSGERYLDYQLFKDTNTFHLNVYPLRTKNPLKLITNIFLNFLVFIKLIVMYLRDRPQFVIGAGGYVCGPTLAAAKVLGIPVFIIEQNAVVGLTNKLLSKIANKIFVNFENTKGLSNLKKVVVTGNPIRPNITYRDNEIGEEVNILVFGGSLGANQINRVIRKLLTKNFQYKVNIVHQVGKDNTENLAYENENVTYKQVEYIDDMDKKYHWCNIIISRAGASTISELRVIKRPTILIPFPYATDNHQFYNATELKNEQLFKVEIIDPKQDEDIIVKKVYNKINEIVDKREFYSKSKEIFDATKKIKSEVDRYVRN